MISVFMCVCVCVCVCVLGNCKCCYPSISSFHR